MNPEQIKITLDTIKNIQNKITHHRTKIQKHKCIELFYAMMLTMVKNGDTEIISKTKTSIPNIAPPQRFHEILCEHIKNDDNLTNISVHLIDDKLIKIEINNS